MFERWKLILSNWNNCYFSHSSKNEPTLDLETLLNIITHLRENLNLDESKSSSFEAHTIKEFIEEKYPEFKFENGTVEPTNEEDIYLVTSLLLFFVCVNSKDVDIKNAMCSKLSSDDQKTILKFSKCLMECSEISYSDVKAAIREACGQDVAAMEVSPRPTVAETPPALRSLHSEVRRLQAALDAERFDRNYLQEELNRTNLRVEKLLKEKAQHKLDIVNLKAKISLCGLETESKDADAASDRSAKLARQLQQIEDKLVETQAQLDDSVYERDVYKKKVEDLKRERDKYLSLSQSEAARVSELSEELDTERRHVQTLKDLITELRQHNRLNILDSSLLECDDPDASILSLPHNSSICSEACANVIEVQLGEERAKTVVLKQQIQSLQDQLNELTTKIESERKTLQNVISDRENNIFNLKHRINEEIEEKNNIKAHYDNEMTKLNNEINELEQRLKDNSEHSRSIIEKKMQEIQTLQEEKLSLLHSLNNETTKLENTIKDLQNDLESEKQNKSSMKENYEAHIMKLNEKVLNRNNELVELQNSVFEKGEVIETLQMELRKEKEAKEELTKQHQELNEQKVLVEQDLQQKKSDVNELQMKLQRNNTIIEDMKSELFDLHTSISDLNNKCKMLEDAREILLTDVQNRDIRIEDALKEVEEITNKFSQENEKLKIDLDEKKVTIQSLQIQLKNEIQFKVQLQNEMDNLNSSLQQATVLNEKLITDLTKMKTDIQDKEKTIDAIDLYLQEEKKLNAQANERIEKLTDHVVKKEKEIKSLKEEVARINDSLLMEIQTNKENVEIAKNKLLCEIAEKESLQMQVKSLEEENVQLEKVIAMKCEEILLLRVALDEHLQKVNERDAQIADINIKVTSAINAGLDKLVETLKQSTVKGIDVQTLEDDRNNDPVNNFEVMMKLAVYLVNELVNEFDKLNDLMEQKDAEILNFKAKVTELEEELTKQSENYITSINSKIKDIHTLQEENKSLQNDLNDVKLQLEVKVHSLKEKLVDNENVTDKLKTTYETQIDNLNVMVTKLTNYLKEMTIEVEALKKDKENLLTTIEDSCKVIKSLEEEIKSEKQNIDKIASEFESERLVLKNMVTVTESVMEDQKVTLNNIIADHLKTIEVLTEENDKLKNNIENYVAKFNSVELINDLLRLMLRQEREVKMQVENESEMVREYLDEVISELKNEKQLKTVLGTQKRELMADIEKCKDDLDAMRKAIGELKETNTVIAKEVNTLLDSINIITEERDALTKKLTNIIAEKTELQSTLEEKTKLVTELQTESKDSKYKLNELIKDKDDLVAKEKDLINKIEEMKQINEEVIEMLKIENEQLVKTVEKTTNDLNETQKTLEDLIQTKLTLENVIDTLKEELINSTSDKTGLEYLLSHKTQQLRNIERESKELKDNLNDLITEKIELIEDKNSYIDKLEEINQANISKENENIAKLNYNIEQLVKTVEEKNTVIEKLERIIKTESELNHKLRDDNEREKYTLIKECTKVQEYQNRAEKQLEERETEITSLQKELTALKTSIEKYEQEAETKDDLISEITKEKDEIIISLTQELSDEKIKLNTLQQDLTDLKASIEQDNNAKDGLISEITKEKDEIINSLTLELSDVKTKLNTLQEEVTNIKISFQQSEHDKKANDSLITEITKEKDEIILSITQELSEEKAMIDTLQQENKAKQDLLSEITYEKDNIITSLTQKLSEEKTKIDTLQQELTNLKGNIEQDNKTKDNQISEIVKEKDAIIHSLNIELSEEKTKINSLQAELTNLKSSLDQCEQENKVKDCLISEISKEKDAIAKELSEEKSKIDTLQQENKAKDDLMSEISKEKDEITKQLSEKKTKIDTLLQENKAKDCLISEISKEKDAIAKELSEEKSKIDTLQQENKAKDGLISKMSKEKDAIINSLTQELSEEKNAREKSEKEAKMILNELKNNMEVRRALMKENDQLTQAIGQQDTFAELCQEKAGGEKYLCLPERRDFQVSTTSDSHSSIESLKTISDLEKIIHDKNRTITTLQSDITYMKTLMAESENKLLDVSKELEVTKENCQQLSNQLKKIVYQKNEEIAELKKQVNKMSATETRATQIIKVSAKYHAMILKRIAEIKTNTVLKELTNFGNTASDNDLRRSLNAGTITMEELEHFLDTTDRHLKRCAEKQIALQKERDRLYEVNRINESEIINLKKFLNELSLSFQTFSSVKNLYAQKLSRVISVQRTVRREILNQEGRITDAAMCRLERGYAAVMQDLAECAMNLERWVERCISRTVSVEKIKQAFTSDSERSSLSSPSFQNAGLEIQLEELEKSFQKLLEEVANVQGDGARDTQAQTVMEVRAQYEDKLNRMKAKMKELMSEQMAVLKDRQRAEIGLLERELQKTRDKMEESKRGYEAHIRELTKELWNVGEKYLVKTDEAEWLKRKQHSGSLMSLQHVHSSGFGPPQEVPSRPSDAHSLRSLPVANNTNKREGRGLHMSDEEGEVFDNRFLKELTATPRREPPANGKRLSELQFRNSLCPPHLKSSYPAETQFVPVLDEEEIKAGSLCSGAGAGGKAQRKEVGITAYKKPGPPTPSKQAGRLSATDSELRESLRVEGDPHPAAVQADRKTSTPARIRAFLSFKTRDNTDGTPRARRLSYNIFRKK